MLITAVEPQKKNPKRLSVYIDEKFAFGISALDALYYHIEAGTRLTEERYEYILNELIYAKARDRAVKLLGFSSRSERELTDKLKQDYSPEICQRVIEMLKGYGYIDDGAYARSYVKDSFNLKSKGSRLIKAELRQRGIEEGEIARAIEEAELNEDEKAAALLKKRLKGNTSPDQKERAKQYRYLSGRGFSHDSISYAFSHLSIETEDWS